MTFKTRFFQPKASIDAAVDDAWRRFCSADDGGDPGGLGGGGGLAGADPAPADPAPADPAPADPTGGGAQPWWQGMNLKPETVRTLEAQKPASIDTLIGNFNELRRRDEGRVSVPAADAPAAEWDQFMGRLPVPEAADGYEFAVPADMPEGMPYDDQLASAFKEAALTAKLMPWQAQAVHDAIAKHNIGRAEGVMTERGEQAEAQLAELRKEPGWQGEGFDKKVAALGEFFNAFPGGGELFQGMKDAGLGHYAPFLKIFDFARENMSEDTLAGAGGGAAEPVDFEKGYAKLVADFGNEAMHDPRHEKHAAAKEAYTALIERQKKEMGL